MLIRTTAWRGAIPTFGWTVTAESKTLVRQNMKTVFILIDFENVQPGNLALLRGRDFKIMVFLGTTQAKLPTDLACELQALRTRRVCSVRRERS